MFEYQASIYIVTEYLEGEDALELLKKRKTISEEQAFEIAYQSLLAIKYLHKQKVMHR
jgi:serine/threonine protein kinase